MSKQMAEWVALTRQFRAKYDFPIAARHNWFPGHMARGMRQMQTVLKRTDVVIEVHDARIPLTGRNLNFKQRITGHLPHILVLNKKDTVEASQSKNWTNQLVSAKNHGLSHVIYTNCKNADRCHGVKSIIPKCAKLIQESERYHRSEKPDANILVIGIPNVGKSSLINALRAGNLKLKGNVTAVGNTPGVTRSVMTKIRVHNDPLIYLIDTPGVSIPNIRDMHMGLKLALCGTLLDHQVGEFYMCDYLLWFLNKHHLFRYVSMMKLDEPMEDTRLLLGKIAIRKGMVTERFDMERGHKRPYPDVLGAAKIFIAHFRQGDFGQICLDLGADQLAKDQDLNINDVL
eukprot:maker-scaffold918_size81203-snap-gene-0.19 protein:Tk10448 transcript:maker-scaffold918_size81203-snap-gene-0.19-mRNA-1 annotation:"mitochondrial gtpase 1"